MSFEAAKRYSLRVGSRKRATRITGPTGVTVDLDTNYEIFLLMDDLPERTKRAVAHGVESVGEFCGLAVGVANEYDIQLGKDLMELLRQLRREQPHRTGATLSERWGETIRRFPVSAKNRELVWMNAIKSYRRKESEITKAACRRLSSGNPRKGRLYAMHVRTHTHNPPGDKLHHRRKCHLQRFHKTRQVALPIGIEPTLIGLSPSPHILLTTYGLEKRSTVAR